MNENSSVHTLIVDCPDRVGLVHDITGVLARHDLNILSQGEFVETETAQFFMRTEFAGDKDPGVIRDELARVLPEQANIRLVGKRKKRVVVMGTKEYHCVGDLLLRHAFGDLDADILAVVSNHRVLEKLAIRFDVPFVFVPHTGLAREVHEGEISRVLERFDPEYLVLAKYMRILTPAFVRRYPNRLINIHHSFLPAFIGANPYRQAFDRGVKIIGATAHFVTERLDDGPIIAQGVVDIDHTCTPSELARAGRDVEKTILARALRLVLEDRVCVSGRRTIIFDAG